MHPLRLTLTALPLAATLALLPRPAAAQEPAGLIVLVSFISPYRAERMLARDCVAEDEFLEIFVDTPVEECRRRDPKGLYRKADAGQIRNFTGVDAPYEAPLDPEIRLPTLSAPPEALNGRYPSSSRITRSRRVRPSAIWPALPLAFSCSRALTSSMVEKNRTLRR